MAPRKLILICQYGGKFVPKRDGSLTYAGGEAHAVDVNPETQFDDLKLELAEMWNIDIKTISVKYLLPSNKRTLITLSNDKDLQRMIDFHGDSTTADVYVVEKESATQAKLKMPINREARIVVTGSNNNIAASPVAATALVAASASQVVDDANNNIAASPTAATAPIAASATQVVDGGVLLTAPDVNTTVIADSPASRTRAATSIAGRTRSATSIAARTRAATTASSSLVAADASPPTDDVRKRRRTASWKIGAKGLAIVSVADDAGQQIHTGTKEENTSSPNTASSGGDPGEQMPSEYSDHETNGNPTVSFTDDFGKGQQKLMDSWKNGITNVGQEFKNVHEFRDALRKYAIANHFVYQLKKNDTDRVSAKCKADGCSWRIHASWVPAARSFKVKKYFKSHTCEDISGFAHHPQATKHWLATLVKEMLRDSPHYKPKEVVSAIIRDFGIELNYSQAWRGMEMAREQLQGSYKEAYHQFPWFCEKVIETNPGSVAKLTTNDDLSFKRLFVSFHASIHGFEKGCRPLIFLDSTSLKSKYQEILLVATAVDANDGAFPIAFAVVDVEDDDSWHWFLEELKSLISTSRSITFVSDKNKDLSNKVLQLFENAQHGYCIHHLLENFKISRKGPFNGDGKGSLAVNFLAAARALRLDEFRKCCENVKTVSSTSYDWIMNSEPQFWASSQFKGEQYNHISLDVVRSFKGWIVEVRELPIVQKINVIRCKMMELINTRRVDSNNYTSKLTPCKEEKLQEESKRSRTLKVLFSSESMFEVHDDFINVVNMDQQECSCRRWKITGIPCSHAIAVFNSTGRSAYDYCSKYFTTEAFQLTYSVLINPLPEIEKPVNSESSEKVLVHPPRTQLRRPKRIHTEVEEVAKRPLHCSKCKGEGHNKASCKATE